MECLGDSLDVLVGHISKTHRPGIRYFALNLSTFAGSFIITGTFALFAQ
jgi:hypothetical protein